MTSLHTHTFVTGATRFAVTPGKVVFHGIGAGQCDYCTKGTDRASIAGAPDALRAFAAAVTTAADQKEAELAVLKREVLKR